MKGLVLAGGKGTRLYPLTYTRAKQLIPVANKPVLVRVIEAIRDAGIADIGIVTGDTGPEIQEALGDGAQFGVALTYIPQSAPLGLAHAVKIARDFIGDDRFVMFLGDNVLEGGIGSLVADFAEHPEWSSQIVLKAVDHPQEYGVAQLNGEGRIVRLVEKPANPPSNLALVGVYMFDHQIFAATDAITPSARGELEITDAIQWLVENGHQVYPHIHTGWWIDTGAPEAMLSANSLVLDEVLRDLAPVIEGTVDAGSDIDSRVIVEAGAEIVNSVIRGPAIIGRNTRIVNSYVGPFSSIYHNVVIEDSEIERSIVLEHSQIANIPTRIENSLIGRYARVGVITDRPRSIRLHLGDYSQVDLLE